MNIFSKADNHRGRETKKALAHTYWCYCHDKRHLKEASFLLEHQNMVHVPQALSQEAHETNYRRYMEKYLGIT